MKIEYFILISIIIENNLANIEKQWTKLVGSSGTDDITQLAIDSNNNIYIAGYTYGNLDGNTNSGGNDSFLTKFNSLGEKQWTKLVGSTGYDQAFQLAIDSRFAHAHHDRHRARHHAGAQPHQFHQ